MPFPSAKTVSCIFNFKLKSPVASFLSAQAAIFLIANCFFTQAWAQTPTPAAPPPLEPSLSYTIQASDKLIRLSRDMLINPQAWADVARYNQLKNANLIVPGQKLAIPLRYLKSQPANGKIISAEGDVTLGGKPVQPGATVAGGVQLKTGVNSSALIELGDGSRIKLLPNSLAEVITSRNYAMRDASSSGSTNWFSGLMRLTTGTLEALASRTANRATPLQIETPTSLVGVRGTEFRVAFEDPTSGSARTEVIEGQVRADNPAQQSGADLPRGTGALIKPTDKEVRVVQLLAAPDLSSIPVDVLKPSANWPMPVLAGAAGWRVQVSSNEGFDSIVRDFKVASDSGTGLESLASLANGRWYARVRGVDAQGLEGFNSIKLIAVKDGQWRVNYSSLSLVDGKTVLGWTGLQADGQPMKAGNYNLLMTKDQALTQTLLSADTSGSNIELGDLKPGVYFLRLRSQLAQGGHLDSETYQMEISGNWGHSVFDQTSALQAVK